MANQWLLKRLRREFRLTQWDLGAAAGLSQIRISQLERGIEEPSWAEQGKIVHALVKYAAARQLENHLFQAGRPATGSEQEKTPENGLLGA